MNRRIFVTVLLCSLITGFCSAEETRTTPAKVRIVLVGDSTVAAKSGWGTAFGKLLGPDAECLNRAIGGQSTKSYLHRKSWQEALELKPAWLLIQFGHNDQPGKGPERETDPNTTYADNLRRMVDEARAAGARPVLITSMVRRTLVDGHLVHDLEPYAEAARRVAAEKKVPLVDLHARSHEFVEKMSQEDMKAMNPPGKTPGTDDLTHLTERGGEMIAPLVVAELRQVAPELAALFPAGK